MIDFKSLENSQKSILKDMKTINNLLQKIDDKKVEPMKQIVSEVNSCLLDLKNPNNIEKLYAINQKMINNLNNLK